MNKKATVSDVTRIFPNATISEDGGVFSLQIHASSPSLRLVIPCELPIGPGAIALLPGDIHIANIPQLCQDLGTDFPVWVAAGSYQEGDEKEGPEFQFEDWMTAKQLLVVARWELTPSVRTASGLESVFARGYKAQALMRITPAEMLGLNQVLLPIPEELAPPMSRVSGLDFWVVERTDFYNMECEMLSESLRQAVLMGEREQYNDTTRAVCKRLMESLAQDIAADARLDGWKLECGDTSAALTLKDRNDRAQTLTTFYTPTYLAGVQRYVEQGREGTLVLVPNP